MLAWLKQFDGGNAMVDTGQAAEQSVGRREQITHTIVTLLRTPQGSAIGQRATGVNYLDVKGRPHAGLGPATVEASVHQALSGGEPQLELDAVTAHFDGNVLISIRVAYRDREDASQHEAIITY